MFKLPPLVVSSHSPEETLFVCGTMLNYCVLLFKVRKHGNKIMFIYLYICYSFYIYICFHQSAECSVLRNLLLEERLWNNLNKGSKMWLLCVDTIICDSLCVRIKDCIVLKSVRNWCIIQSVMSTNIYFCCLEFISDDHIFLPYCLSLKLLFVQVYDYICFCTVLNINFFFRTWIIENFDLLFSVLWNGIDL